MYKVAMQMMVVGLVAFSGVASAQSLSIAGTCPGVMSFSASGLTPGGQWALISANGEGSAALPGGPCAGVASGLSNSGLALRGVFTASGSGTGGLAPSIPAPACGAKVQAVDLRTCTFSDVETLGGSCEQDSFEGDYPGSTWMVVSGAGTVVSSPAYDGSRSVQDPNWVYGLAPVDPTPGNTVGAWIWAGTGRHYLGFDSSAGGTKSFVVAPNTGDIRFQDNPAYGYTELTIQPTSVPTGVWLYAEVTFDSATRVTGRLYNAAGGLIGSVSQDYSGGFGGGSVAMRSFGTGYFDLVGIGCE